jgi:hypothetical protein
VCFKNRQTIPLTVMKSLASFFDYTCAIMKKNLIILKNSVMKQVLLLIAIAAVTSVAVVGLTSHSNSKKVDATELAQFQAWKDANQQQQNYVAPVHTTKSATTKRSVNYSSPKMVSESQNTAKTVVKKKGWSKAAKGTAIGAGAGAVLGAVINKKNRAVGAVIGGVLGGGGGYVLGHTMDKKDGRY